MKKQLTEKQKQIFDYVVEYIQTHHFAPSIREIAERFNFASPTAAAKHLRALENKGMLKLHGAARSIEILQQPTPSSNGIPILGKVPAGTPVLAVQNFDEWLTLGQIFGEMGNLFSLKVEGDSMMNAGIFDGDFVIVRHQPEVQGGEIGVAIVGEDREATVKRIFFERDSVRLQPENPSLEPSVYAIDDNDFQIVGKVVGVVRKL